MTSTVKRLGLRLFPRPLTALCKRVRYKVFVESRAPQGSQQKLWFDLSTKRCIYWSFDYCSCNAEKCSLRERFSASLVLAPIFFEKLTASAFQKIRCSLVKSPVLSNYPQTERPNSGGRDAVALRPPEFGLSDRLLVKSPVLDYMVSLVKLWVMLLTW